jgi:6-phosphogluconolactonase
MKFNKWFGIALAAATSIAMGLGSVACSRDYVVAYVFSTSASNGTVSAYAVDYQSGELTQVSGSPFTSQVGTNPVTLVAAPNQKFIYIIGGSPQSSVLEEMAVGTDGKLYGQNTYNLASGATYATAAAIDPAGKFLYVTFTFVSPYGPGNLGRGGISVFPINADNSLGTPTTVPVGNNPVAIVVSPIDCAVTTATGTGQKTCTPTNGSTGSGFANSFVYVVDQEGIYNNISYGSNTPHILGFAQNTSTGALTLLSGSSCAVSGTLTTCKGYPSGVTPSAIAIDPTGRYVYVTDKTSNQIIGYSLAIANAGSGVNNGNLTPLVSSPYNTGLYPVQLTIDPRGKYIYTVNYNSNNVSAYSISTADGSLSGAGLTGNFSTSTGPTCVTIDPALGIYLYTSNYLDSSISGGQLSPNTGNLTAVVNTPFPAGTLPSCVISVTNGSHASSIVNP